MITEELDEAQLNEINKITKRRAPSQFIPPEARDGKLVNAKKLLELLFDEDSRPSLRTLRNWTAANAIPFVRLGHLVFFSPDKVREALQKKSSK
jgi:hypothetical protein